MKGTVASSHAQSHHSAQQPTRQQSRGVALQIAFLSLGCLLVLANLVWHSGQITKERASSSDNNNEENADSFTTWPIMAATGVAAATVGNSSTTTSNTSVGQEDLRNRVAQLEESVHSLKQQLQSNNSSSSRSTNSEKEEQPSCRELMSRPYSPFHDGDFLTQSPYVWIPRADGSRQLELLSPCRLHRYSVKEARQCLADQHVSFMGDSLSRYLFLSLAYFIENGEYPPRFGQARRGQFMNETTVVCPHINEQGQTTCAPSDQPNPVMEEDWKRNLKRGQDAWELYLQEIGGGKDGGMFHGHMECDCARSSSGKKGHLCKADCQVENELYISDPVLLDSSSSNNHVAGEWDESFKSSSSNNNNNTNIDDVDYSQRILLSHVKENGWGDPARNISGFSFTKCGATGSCRRSTKTANQLLDRAINGDVEWNEPLYMALQNSLRKVLPPATVGIYNKGLWGAVSEETLDKVMPALYNFTGQEKGRCFFRSTTGSPRTIAIKIEEHERVMVKKKTYHYGCSFLDFGRLTQDFARLEYRGYDFLDRDHSPSFLLQERNSVYWDAVHFLPWVYEELNNMMLNVLCNNAQHEHS